MTDEELKEKIERLIIDYIKGWVASNQKGYKKENDDRPNFSETINAVINLVSEHAVEEAKRQYRRDAKNE